MSSQPTITAEDAVQVAQRALQNLKDLEETVADQQDSIERLEQRVQELEALQPENKDYDQLTRDEKVGLVRSHLVTKANNSNGIAQLDYKGVLWEVFDGEPSDGHCYKLMDLAEDAPGFTVGENSSGEKALKVQTSKITSEERQRARSRVNNEEQE